MSPSHRRPVHAAPAALLAAALLAAGWPSPAAGANKTFSAGSLIIPASVEYQTDDGVLNAYGLVYVTLWKNAARVAAGQKAITFYWAVQPLKLSQYRCNTMTNDPPKYTPTYNDNDGCDFDVESAAGQPVALLAADGTEQAPFNVSNLTYQAGYGPLRANTTHAIGASTTMVKYLGGAWIVDSTDRQAFLDMLANTPELAGFHRSGTGTGNYTAIHSARANFIAPVASVMSSQPPLAALTGSAQTAFLANVLVNAGVCTATTIPNCAGLFANGSLTPGVVYDYYPNSDDLLAQQPAYPAGRLNAAVNGTRRYGLLWAGAGTTTSATSVPNVSTFLDGGNHVSPGNVFAEYDAIAPIEDVGLYQTTGGVDPYMPNVSNSEDCNDGAAGSQTVFFHGNGGGCLVFGGANQPYAQTGNFSFDGGQGSFKAFTPTGTRPLVNTILNVSGGPTVSSAIRKDGSPNKGLVIYLGGHKFDNGRYWGERIILNTLFAQLNPLTGMELARSEPVGYKDTTVSPSTVRAYQGTYVQQPLPDVSETVTYSAAKPHLWQFPFVAGHFYEYDVGSIATTTQTFGANRNWDAAALLPLPGSRALFTYVDGSANLGWRKIDFSYRETGASCHDYDGNGKCDLSELLAACNAAGVTTAQLQAKSVNGVQAQTLGMLVQQARGFCSSHTPAVTGTPNFTPTDAQCDCGQPGVLCSDPPQANRAALGGVDHGSAAVVGPSRYVTDAPYATRPVVAYAAGHDGMLHAFYVSGSTSWTGDGATLPPGVVPGQELWALVPPGQVCGIATNNALLDGSLNVVDVFGDFPIDRNNDGVIDWTLTGSSSERPDHVRRWRTVLVATAGPGGSEMFGLDVTNPLRPVLLWHLGGATEHDGRWDANASGAFDVGESFSVSDATTYALKWFDWDDGLSSTAWIPTDYNTTNQTVLDAIKLGKYDYRNLGRTYGTSIAKIWNGAAFRYVAFAATTAADYTQPPSTGFRGVEVFAVDVVTGEKVWQWEHLYASTDASGIDNSIPPAIALGDIDANGSTERIYVADMEGHLWELLARDGRNVNYLPASDGAFHSFPLFGTPTMVASAADATTKSLYRVAGGGLGQQPLTTPIGEGRFTASPAGNANAAFQPALLTGRLALVLGTMGVDWAIAPFEAGHVFVLPVYPDAGTRRTAPIDLNTGTPLQSGIVLPAAVVDVQLATGERVYGMPRVVNNTILFNTAFGSFTGDISASATDPGNLYTITAAASSHATNDSKSFGGVLVVEGSVVVTTDTSIHVVANPLPALTGGNYNVTTFNRATPAIVKTWEPVAP